MPGNHDNIKKENDKFLKESQVSFFKFQEHHNPLDIPFGHEVHEVNMEVDNDQVDEGGMGSGPSGSAAGNVSGSQAGPLITFGLNETISKQLMDAKLKESCPCHNKKN